MSGPDRTPVPPELREGRPFLWPNPGLAPAEEVLPGLALSMADIEDAADRLERFAPLLASLFDELARSEGVIESPLMAVPAMKWPLERHFRAAVSGSLLLKADHALAVAGSVKARGGIYEVLCLAEKLALENGLLRPGEAYTALGRDAAREFFGRYTVSVGSTGNLGLSIGIMAASLGFRAVVHMSVEARAWKKALLRRHGVTIVEHPGDYTSAVKAGREAARGDPFAYFVDDENSPLLFLGYSVAALRLKGQLAGMGIEVDATRQLVAYLPCGVGGAPGGICFGLKHVFGDAIHCVFVEPVEAPCFLLGMLAGFEREVSVYDIGLSLATQADGLAVSSPSGLAGRMVRRLVSACGTVTDDDLFRFVYLLEASTGIRIEPSAAAGFSGLAMLYASEAGAGYRARHGLDGRGDSLTHLVWTTGGSLVPKDEYAALRERGKVLCGE